MKQIDDGLQHELWMLAGASDGDVWMYSAEGAWRERGGQLTRLGAVRSAFALGLGKAMAAGGPETLYLSGDVHGTKGVFRSADEGKTWVRIDDKEHEYGVVSPIAGDPRVAGRVYLGTNGFGVVVAEPE